MSKCDACTEECPKSRMIHEIAYGRMYATAEFVSLIKKIENGELVPVVHGEWRMQKHDIYTTCACSQCGTEFEWSLMTYRFCPNCGARMDRGEINA